MKITFLSADRALTKSYVFKNDGTYDSTPYPRTYEFTSHEHIIDSLEDMFAKIVAHGSVGHCMLKGNLQKVIRNEPREGLVVPEQTQYIVLDFDGLDPKGKSIDEILSTIGLGGISYILQYSASQGIKDGLNAHVFMMLKEPQSPEILKKWLKWKNLTIPFLEEQISLTKTGMALHWPLDITVCQNDKLIYIASPNIIGKGDPIKIRRTLVHKEHESVVIPFVPSDIDTKAKEKVVQLRRGEGLPDNKLKTTYVNKYDADVLVDPDKASITGVKRHGLFTYVNINGGDSWGYYHLTSVPEILYNFKGEPNYKLSELCPDYYKDAKAHARTVKLNAHRPKELNSKPKCWIINKVDEGRYFKVTYIPEQGITLSPAPSEKHIVDWCILKNIPIPEVIEDWEVLFNPTTMESIFAEDKVVNIYSPTKFKVQGPTDEEKESSVEIPKPYNCTNMDSIEITTKDRRFLVPPEYFKLISHMCGNDEESTNRLVNWLAYIWQTGKRPKTAWLFHGVYGTGKGRFLKVLKKLFGDHCVSIGPEGLEDKFNEHLAYAQIVWLDEVTTDAWDNEKMTPKLRALIDGEMGMRGMRKAWRNMELFFGLLIAANEYNAIEIRYGDRRFNVCPRQERKLDKEDWFCSDVFDDDYGSLYEEANLQAFADYLALYPVDAAQVRVPMENEAKTLVMNVTQNLPEDIVQSLEKGNVSFFLEFVQPPGVLSDIETDDYKKLVSKMMEGGRVAFKTTDIRKIFSFLAGWNQSPAKFNKAAAKFGLHLRGSVVRDGNKVLAGKAFDFEVTDSDRVLWAQLNDTKLKVVRDARDI